MKISNKSQETNSNPSTSSPAVSPVKTYPRRANGPDSREIARAFGLNSPVSLGSFDPDTFLLKTYQVSLIDGQCQELLENWPDSGMWDLGSAYELRSSAPPISEKESSLWPTAVAADDGKTPEAHLAMKQRMGERDGSAANRTQITSLAVKVQAWPTPRQEDGESRGNHPGASDSLTGVTRNWPTPNAHDGTGARGPGFELTDGHTKPHDLVKVADQWRTPDSPGTGGPRNRQGSIGDGHQITIAEQAEHWPTPDANTSSYSNGVMGPNIREMATNWQTPATDSFRSRGGDRKEEPGLDQQARMFPTPAARDYRTPNKTPDAERRENKKGPQLQNFVAHHLDLTSPPVPPIPAGQKSSQNSPPLPRRLNPRFVEWLMGFPIGWTEL
jgi:hypothetical protein